MAKPPIRVVAYAPFTARDTSPQGPNWPLRTMLNDDDDIVPRCNALIDRLRAANTFIDATFPTDPADTLRLFLAPEWYFRRFLGVYQIEAVVQAIQMLLAESTALPNFIIVPGSFYWGVVSPGGGLIDYRDTQVFNTAPVIHNGALYCLYHKRDEVDIDASRRRFETWGSNSPGAQARFDELAAALARFAPPGGAIDTTGRFDVGELTLGLEICADHNNRRLLNLIAPGDRVDLHLVIASGMSLRANNLICKKWGYVALCDGKYDVLGDNLARATEIGFCRELVNRFGDPLNTSAALIKSHDKRVHDIPNANPNAAPDTAHRIFVFEDLVEFREPLPLANTFDELRAAVRPRGE